MERPPHANCVPGGASSATQHAIWSKPRRGWRRWVERGVYAHAGKTRGMHEHVAQGHRPRAAGEGGQARGERGRLPGPSRPFALFPSGGWRTKLALTHSTSMVRGRRGRCQGRYRAVSAAPRTGASLSPRSSCEVGAGARGGSRRGQVVDFGWSDGVPRHSEEESIAAAKRETEGPWGRQAISLHCVVVTSTEGGRNSDAQDHVRRLRPWGTGL